MDDKQKNIIKASVAGLALVAAALLLFQQYAGSAPPKLDTKAGQAADQLTDDLTKKQQAANAKNPPPPDPEPDMPRGAKRKAVSSGK